jgi:hypothetical protein
MLSGRVPFKVVSSEDQAKAIMNEIKMGRFNFDGQEWEAVSDAAKALIQGNVLQKP